MASALAFTVLTGKTGGGGAAAAWSGADLQLARKTENEKIINVNLTLLNC